MFVQTSSELLEAGDESGRATPRACRFIDQTGADTESIYGGQFRDDQGGLTLKHDRRGLLSAANAGPGAPCPSLGDHSTLPFQHLHRCATIAHCCEVMSIFWLTWLGETHHEP